MNSRVHHIEALAVHYQICSGLEVRGNPELTFEEYKRIYKKEPNARLGFLAQAIEKSPGTLFIALKETHKIRPTSLRIKNGRKSYIDKVSLRAKRSNVGVLLGGLNARIGKANSPESKGEHLDSWRGQTMVTNELICLNN